MTSSTKQSASHPRPPHALVRRIVQLACIAGLAAAIFAPPASAAVLEVDCNMVGSGGNWIVYPSIAAALAVPAQPGDVIAVQPCQGGNYNMGFSIIGMNDIHIVGAHEPSNVVGSYPGGDGTSPPNPGNPVLFDLGTSCAYIESSSNISIVGLAFEYCDGDGFTIVDSNHIHIDGNTVYGAGGDGVAIRDSSHVEITGNYLFHASNAGSAGISMDAQSNTLEIKYNRVRHNWTGIYMEGTLVDVVLNEVVDNEDTGIVVAPLTRASTVSRNTALGNGTTTGGPEIDFATFFPDTCLVGNETNGGILFGAVCATWNN